MGTQAVFKDRKRGHEDAPSFKTLAELTNQGAAYKGEAVHCELCCSMGQPGPGYHSNISRSGNPKLPTLMGQG